MSGKQPYPEPAAFEQLYTRLRQQEGRMYTDEEVAILPNIHTGHPHYKEWLIRKRSSKALLSYLKQKGTVLNILEVGCGNGWLCAQLAKSLDVEVTGLDINSKELKQAGRVFNRVANLKFVNGSLAHEYLEDKKFDIILFAAAIQYFPSLKHTIGLAVKHLTLQGEINIMDSPFYQQQELEAARQRTKAYYLDAGFETMAGHYHHHTLAELDGFQFKILHHPFSWKNKLSIKKNPFYWITIKNRFH